MMKACRPFPAPEPLEPRIAPATFTVTSLLDNNSGGTLREAIASANATPAADTIVFQTGLTGTIALTGALQVINITAPLTIKGPGIDKLAISGGDGIRIFFITDGNAAKQSPVSISGLSLVDGGLGTNGGALYSLEPLTLSKVLVASSGVNNLGGGIYVDTTGKVSITDCKFLDNVGPFGGGGVFIAADSGVVMTRTVISGNETTENTSYGGGAVIESLGSKGFIQITDCLIADNESYSSGGLALAVDANKKISITRTTVDGNSAVFVGGVSVFGVATIIGSHFTDNETALAFGTIFADTGTSLTISGSLVEGNTALGVFFKGKSLKISSSQFVDNASVGLYIEGTGTATISSSLFQGNESTAGGAVSISSSGVISLTGNNFIGNRADDGGAIYVTGGAKLTIKGGVFRDNYATDDGGAIAMAGTGAAAPTVTLSSVLFQGNYAEDGGAVHAREDALLKITSAKFFENSALNGGAVRIEGSSTTTIISGSQFRGNYAGTSAGALAWGGTAGLTISSSRFFDNEADLAGTLSGTGGAFYLAGPGTATLTGVQVTGNYAFQAGGLYNAGATVVLKSTTISGNYAPTDPNTYGL